MWRRDGHTNMYRSRGWEQKSTALDLPTEARTSFQEPHLLSTGSWHRKKPMLHSSQVNPGTSQFSGVAETAMESQCSRYKTYFGLLTRHCWPERSVSCLGQGVQHSWMELAEDEDIFWVGGVASPHLSPPAHPPTPSSPGTSVLIKHYWFSGLFWFKFFYSFSVTVSGEVFFFFISRKYAWSSIYQQTSEPIIKLTFLRGKARSRLKCNSKRRGCSLILSHWGFEPDRSSLHQKIFKNQLYSMWICGHMSHLM